MADELTPETVQAYLRAQGLQCDVTHWPTVWVTTSTQQRYCLQKISAAQLSSIPGSLNRIQALKDKAGQAQPVTTPPAAPSVPSVTPSNVFEIGDNALEALSS